VPERVVLSDTFLTRNLVSAHAAERPFWVLSVAADRVSLWNGGTDRVAEEKTGGFPLSRSLVDPDAERQERVGDLPSTFRDEHTRRFLRDADTALGRVLRTHPRPLYVSGEPAALAALAEAGFSWYEVSNWATSADARCRHNLLYWTGADWWGLGPGAHSHVGGVRWWNVKHPAAYAQRLASGVSPALAREVLGYQPRVTLEEGLLDIAEWLEGQTAVDRAAHASRELMQRGLTI
jgi:hypothetical protein